MENGGGEGFSIALVPCILPILENGISCSAKKFKHQRKARTGFSVFCLSILSIMLKVLVPVSMQGQPGPSQRLEESRRA